MARCAGRVAEIEERLRIFRASPLAEVARDQPTHVLAGQLGYLEAGAGVGSDRLRRPRTGSGSFELVASVVRGSSQA